MSLLNLLLQSMSSQSSVSSLSHKTGVSDAAVKALVAAAIPLLLKSLTKNASSQSGATSLLQALSQHKNTKTLSEQISGADEEDGAKIIGHIFGDNTSAVMNQLAGQTGMNASQVSSVLGNMAPALLSSLSAAAVESKQQQSASAQAGGLGGLLGGLLGGGQAQQASAPAGGLLGSLFGGGQTQQASAPAGGLLGSILGGGAGGDILGGLLGGDDDDDNDNGSGLLNSLLGLMQ